MEKLVPLSSNKHCFTYVLPHTYLFPSCSNINDVVLFINKLAFTRLNQNIKTMESFDISKLLSRLSPSSSDFITEVTM